MGIIPTEADGQGCIEGVYMTALVGLIMGSDSDWVTVEPTVEVLAGGMDSLLSIVQMPAGVPVATVSIGGAKNAGLLAVRILGAGDPALLDQMAQYQEKMRLEVEEKDRRLRRLLLGE